MVSSKNDPGYEAAIAAVREQQGIDRGAASWLAEQLSSGHQHIGRQHVFYWKKSGFPDEIIPRVARLLKMPQSAFARGNITVKMPRPVWDQLCDGKPKSLIDQTKIL